MKVQKHEINYGYTCYVKLNHLVDSEPDLISK